MWDRHLERTDTGEDGTGRDVHRTGTVSPEPASLSGPLGRATILTREVLRDARGLRTEPRPTPEHVRAGVRWLYRSQDVTGVGGSASNYNLVLGWGGAYPETSGYIVPTLFDYASWWGDGEAYRRAQRMAEWLLETQLPDGGFPAGDDPATTVPSVFNTGQILLGLTRAAEETRDDRYRRAAVRASRWLRDVQHENGSWNRFDYRDTAHTYASRIAWALLRVDELTNGSAFRETAVDNLSWVLDNQRENGWFDHAGFGEDEDPYLHTIAYTIRGLLEGGCLLDEPRFVDAARHSADVLLDLQERDGILTGQFDATFDGSSFYCLTGNAQMAIIWYRLFEHTGNPRYRRAADETIRFLKTHHRLDGPAPVRGGLKGSSPIWGRYMYLRYPNWATKFLLDALLLHDEHHE